MTAPTPPRFTFIGMAVDDMAASLAFYRLLGLDIPADGDTRPHVEAPLPGGLLLVWDTVASIRTFHPDWEDAKGSRTSLAFTCADPAAVDAAYAALTAAGYAGPLAPFDAPWGQRYASVLDPDGNGVDLLAVLPAD
ncbi:VOC family protein [Yinghuangia soli]|uniref:VOC family protein n=1 Tax=Yinghuangia soli TaxID=2908204 RepID=A0AA41U6K1_9ACTN|nr:VOC family protein [Yinghuangia soli]MCF2533087.1 VOC family protein [Yinghuangia soli]